MRHMSVAQGKTKVQYIKQRYTDVLINSLMIFSWKGLYKPSLLLLLLLSIFEQFQIKLIFAIFCKYRRKYIIFTLIIDLLSMMATKQ